MEATSDMSGSSNDATPPPLNPELQTVQSAIDLLGDVDLKSLERASELGADFNFRNEVEKLRAIRGILIAYRDGYNPLQMPTSLPGSVNGQAAQLAPILEEMRAFSPGGIDQPRAAHEQIERRIEDIRTSLVESALPHIRGREIAGIVTLAELNEALQQARTNSGEIDRLLTSARQQAGEAASGRISAFHDNRVKQYKRQADNFLKGIVGSAAVLGALGVAFFVIWPPDTSDTASDWQPFTAALVVRLFFLGLVSYGLAFFARNYRISRHLEVTHEQRRVALDTYPLLVAAIDVDEVSGVDARNSGIEARNIITAEVARSAFGPIESGFLQEDRERTVVETQPSMLAALGALRR